MSAETTCKGCGREIVWAEDEKGQSIPLDPRPPIYVTDGNTCARAAHRKEKNARGFYYAVSHFATCPKASEFSGRNKKGET